MRVACACECVLLFASVFVCVLLCVLAPVRGACAFFLLCAGAAGAAGPFTSTCGRVLLSAVDPCLLI